MNKQQMVFGMLKPLDLSLSIVVSRLKKYNLMDITSQSFYFALKNLLTIQYKLMNDLKVENADIVPEDGGVIFALNHQSWADVQAFGASCPRRLFFVAKTMLKKWPILRHLIEITGGVYVSRAPKSKTQTSGELSEVISLLQDGKAICMFPEGTIPGEENVPRHHIEPRTGLLKGRSGIIRLALEAKVPIIPVGISGTGRAFPPEIYPRLEVLRLPGNTPMKVKYGQPIYLNEYYDKDLTSSAEGRKTLRKITDGVMKDISDLVDHSWNYIPIQVPVKPLPKYKKVGVLLLHGFTSSLDTVNGLIPYLEKEGIDFEMPVLRGHGTKFEDLAGKTAMDWYIDAEKALKVLYERVDTVIVMGLSMGGLLSIDLGIHHPEKIAGITTVAAALKFADPLSGLTPVLSKFIRFWPSPKAFHDNDLAKNSTNYTKFATDAFSSLFNYTKEIEEKLERLTVPIRIHHSKKDQVINPVSANIIYEKISSQTREIVWFNKSGHEMMQDMEAKNVFESIMEFVNKFRKDVTKAKTDKKVKLSDTIE